MLIDDSGELTGDAYDKALEKPVDPSGDNYEDFPEDEAETILAPRTLEIVTELKDLGNKAFKANDLGAALKKYQKGLRYLNYSAVPQEGDPPTTDKDLQALRFTLHNNSALMQIKQGDFGGATKSATYAIEMEDISDEQKGKAYYRRALARSGKKSDDEALEDLVEAQKLVPNDSAIAAELAGVKKRAAERKQKEKAAYAKFFQ